MPKFDPLAIQRGIDDAVELAEATKPIVNGIANAGKPSTSTTATATPQRAQDGYWRTPGEIIDRAEPLSATITIPDPAAPAAGKCCRGGERTAICKLCDHKLATGVGAVGVAGAAWYFLKGR